jgi:hypothetical protein
VLPPSVDSNRRITPAVVVAVAVTRMRVINVPAAAAVTTVAVVDGAVRDVSAVVTWT